jgi:hypothetical protein
MRLKWPSRHKENYPFLVTCSFLWVTKIAINFPLGKHFSWPITCEWKTEGKLGFRYHLSKEKLKEVILGQIFTLTSFLNNLLNFLRVILENAIGSTDKYKQIWKLKFGHEAKFCSDFEHKVGQEFDVEVQAKF